MGTYDTVGGTPRHDRSFDDDEQCPVCDKRGDDCKCPPAQGADARDAARYRWLRDGCRSARHMETMERILANWMDWTPREGDEAIDAAIAQGDTNAPANWLDQSAQPAEPGEGEK